MFELPIVEELPTNGLCSSLAFCSAQTEFRPLLCQKKYSAKYYGSFINEMVDFYDVHRYTIQILECLKQEYPNLLNVSSTLQSSMTSKNWILPFYPFLPNGGMDIKKHDLQNSEVKSIFLHYHISKVASILQKIQ